jgi:hypothetical protein
MGAMMLVTVRPRPPSRQVLDNWKPAVRIMFQPEVTPSGRLYVSCLRVSAVFVFVLVTLGSESGPGRSPLSPIINLKAEPLVRLHLGPARAPGRQEPVGSKGGEGRFALAEA